MPDEPSDPVPSDENASATAQSDEATVGDAAEAARSALARARAAARAKGLRPGLKPRRRVRDVPVDEIQQAFREAYPRFYGLGKDAAKETFG